VKVKIAISLASVLAAAGLLVAGCGGGGGNSSTSTAGSASTSGESKSAGGGEGSPAGAPGAPSEAQAAATGDIPDNQVFLLFHNPKAGYSIRYPEGWARTGSGNNVTFQEKANVIHIAVRKGAPHGKPGVKTTYSRMSAPDPVTGKRLRLLTDRYEYGNRGKVVILDLATPEGVDNVDAYRMISNSFEWLR
jgi:hypothetical protein